MKIQSGALKNGQEVVSAGTNFLYAGQQLKVYND
jgi:hypothetical protein